MNFCLLKNALIFKVSGRHAERYLNARLSNNVKKLTPDKGQFAACITAQGRTQVYGAVLKISDTYLYHVDGGDAAEVKQYIRQFIVADQVDTEDLSEVYQVIHVLSEKNEAQKLQALLDALQVKTNLNVELSISQNAEILSCTRKRSATIGVDILCAGPAAAEQVLSLLKEQSAKELAIEELAYLQICSGIVSYPNELVDLFFPEAQLDAAISDNKGCYCGQEAVEMVRSRGKLPATLVAYHAAGNHSIAKDCNLYSKADQVTALAKVLSSAYSAATDFTAIFVRLRQNANSENVNELVENASAEVQWKRI